MSTTGRKLSYHRKMLNINTRRDFHVTDFGGFDPLAGLG
jgi:hypothetical protein